MAGGRSGSLTILSVLLLATFACNEAAPSAREAFGEPIGPVVIPFVDLPRLPEVTEPALARGRLQLLSLDGRTAFLGSGGGLAVLEDGRFEIEETSGLNLGSSSAISGVVELDDEFLAYGHEFQEFAIRDDRIRPRLWSSPDGRSWSEIEWTGLEAGYAEIQLASIARDGDGLVAVGVATYQGNDVPSAWVSGDGRSWQQLPTPGLNRIDVPDEAFESLADVAVVDDTFIAIREQRVRSRIRYDLVRGRRDGPWAELEPAGLDRIGLPEPGPQVLALEAVGDEFVLLATVPDDENRDARRAALFTSPDGDRWTQIDLDAPEPTVPDVGQVLIGQPDLLLAGTQTNDALLIWRFET